ncbi:MAG: hypothetical protein M3O36_06970 [Myxococcota bacterium]|nr:hypothetical protein [Myxococcota bacterium]
MFDKVCSSSTCVADFTRKYEAGLATAPATGRVYDPLGARRCTDAVAVASCLDDDYQNLCTRLWNGTQPLGSPCGATQTCQTSDAAPAECSASGVCIAKAAAAPAMGPPLGAACSGTCSGSKCVIVFGGSGGQCQHGEGLACIGGMCQGLRKQGDACSGSFACTDPLACINGVCAARLAMGTACVPTSDDNPCDVGLGCVSGACTTLKSNGQPCQTAVECLENRCSAGQCIRQFAFPICGPSP